MVRIPDAISVASLDTHCLIVTVPNDGPADVASSLPRPVAAGILRRLADALENDTTPCGRAAATGEPCPVHDAQRPRSLDDLLDHVADQLADDGKHPADGEQPRPHPNPFALDPEQVEHAQQQLGAAFAEFGRKLRTAMEQAAANLRDLAEQHADTTDPRPRLEVDLEPTERVEPVDAAPAVPTVVDCAHGYGLLRDSCPGCDAEQETPHDADPVTIRPEWAKRNMRRCRRCTLRPSHPIHKAAK